MLIYRIENSDGIGMYMSSAATIAGLSMDDYRHPMPEDDGIGPVPRDFFFGFSSIKQMLDWCEIDIILNMFETGTTVSVYDASLEDVIVGSRQAVFIRSNAVLIERYDRSQICQLERPTTLTENL